MPKRYIGTRTTGGPAVWVSRDLMPEGVPGYNAYNAAAPGRGYSLRWTARHSDGWKSLELARALLVDLCDGFQYRDRRDLHRTLASEVLAALPKDRWVLTEAQLVDWLVEAHSASIWRKRAAANPAPNEPWPWEERAALQASLDVSSVAVPEEGSTSLPAEIEEGMLKSPVEVG